MDVKIEEELKKSEFKSQEDLDNHINYVLSLINEFEQYLYDKEDFTTTQQAKIRRWRQVLFNKSQLKNTIEEIPEVLESTVRIVNRQLNKMDTNKGLLRKGTLKLIGLNYTNEDIEKGLSKTKSKL